ncbi:MAG: ABC transporter permease subunit [Clostridiales bacterium]|jgi:ABC-type transport system involved in multi-copper enzyme maturation permease subunit|nr:ABC transporter permease subunit [Clostridiales bacterium]
MEITSTMKKKKTGLISKPLLKQSIKANWVLWVISTAVICLFVVLITSMMSSSTIVDMLKAQRGNNFDINALLGNMFYGMMGPMVPIIYIVITANGLVASQVDRGSMAYVLSTPTKRSTVAVTQMLFLIGSLFITFTLLSIFAMASQAAVFGNVAVGNTLLMNLGCFIEMTAIAGICYMCSCLFNLSKYSLGIGGGIAVWFFLAKMLGNFGDPAMPMGADALKIFNYTTMFSLFDTQSIVEGTTAYIWKLAILVAVAVVTFAVGITRFKKKDLPL